ncbi:TetR/AcrR family transcriptional regulator [Poseidonocella sp. HB161398]|uniref:TetR/AcrR family transcriptional regulator n=1 Tax=Poseidonocella sp. HB161398 TaxID=2320855 RepID=UPI001109662F|nr:TetR/AcrR family transcriptional regulator [Poseidonocella sp. HB161398]
MAAETGARKPYHHGDLRRALVDAARALVEEKGAAHFSVAQAARQAGVSSAAPYRHFRDREEMLDAVAGDGLARMAERFRLVAEGLELGSVEAVLRIGLAYIDFAVCEPAVFRLMFAELQEKSEETCAAGEACHMHLLCHVAARMGREEVDETVFAAALPLWTMVHGIAFLKLDGKFSEDCMPVELEPILRNAVTRLLPG